LLDSSTWVTSAVEILPGHAHADKTYPDSLL